MLESLKDFGELGIGAAAGMGLYLGALRARLTMLREEMRLTRRTLRKYIKRQDRIERRLRHLPCTKTECRNEPQQPPDPDRVLGGH